MPREGDGAMKRIEELLSFSRNGKRYNYLRSELGKNRLAVFFGAGLSLGGDGARKWAGPFSEICNSVLMPKLENLENYIRKSEKLIRELDSNYEENIQGIEPIRNLASGIRTLLSEARESILDENFLEAGDALAKAWEQIKRAYCCIGIAEDLDDLEGKSFDDIIVDVFTNDPDMEVQEIYDSPYKIRALFFLPYIGNALITTNIDASFEEVIKRLGVQTWHRILAQTNSKIEMNWIQETKRIFYIHGHISEPSSLVMTGAEYDKMYPKAIPADGSIYGARELLSKTVRDKSILFLGASLRQDKTVEIINLEAEKNTEVRKSEKLHFIPVVGANVLGVIGVTPDIRSSKPILYSEGEYQEIPLLLLQLIRDTNVGWCNCKWVEPSYECEHKDISDKLKGQLDNFLSPSVPDSFAEKTILEKDIYPSDLIHYLYKHHSIAQHDCGLGWNICCITKNEFTLDGYTKGENFSPLHNYPIGDTVYILYSEQQNIYGESSLYNERALTIKEDIKKWRENDFPFYIGKRGKSIFDNFSPRIRVIIFPSDMSPKKKELQWESEKENENVKKIISTLDSKFTDVLEKYPQYNRTLTFEEQQSLREHLEKLLVALHRAIRLANEVETYDCIDDRSSSKTLQLQRTLDKGGSSLEQNLQ